MTRRKRIKRWMSAWRRLIAFGKMLQELNEQGFTLITWAAHGAQVRVQSIEGMHPEPVGRAAAPAKAGEPVKVLLNGEEIGDWETKPDNVTPIASAKDAFAGEVAEYAEPSQEGGELRPLFGPEGDS